jgi:hypothetical protein
VVWDAGGWRHVQTSVDDLVPVAVVGKVEQIVRDELVYPVRLKTADVACPEQASAR